MNPIQLTDVERILLANQCEILGLLTKDDGHTKMAKNLRDGHTWLYKNYFQQISDNLPDSDVDHVLAILGIYSDLKDSYGKLSDKSGVDKRLVRFPGFDGNNESDLLCFAQALTDNGSFSETIGKSAQNSHMPTREMYGRMIEEWKAMGEPSYPYSKDQILQIIQAKTHPENRK